MRRFSGAWPSGFLKSSSKAELKTYIKNPLSRILMRSSRTFYFSNEGEVSIGPSKKNYKKYSIQKKFRTSKFKI